MFKSQQTQTNHKVVAFTLIELLITIVIIGVLASISISTFQGYEEKARIARIQAIEQIIERQVLADSARNGIGPVARWDFDEGVDEPFEFFDRENYNWRHFPASYWTTDTLDGKGYAMDLTNPVGTQFISGFSKVLTDEYSFALRLKMDSDLLANQNRIFTAVCHPSGEQLKFFLSGGKNSLGFRVDEFQNSAWTALIETPRTVLKKPDEWHHIALSYSPKEAKIFIDGELFYREENPPAMTNSCLTGNITGFLILGSSPITGTRAIVDNIRVWSRTIEIASPTQY